MRTLTIDVTDLGGQAQPGDSVVLWKPAPAGSVLAVQAKSSHGNAWNRQINGASAKITWIDEG